MKKSHFLQRVLVGIMAFLMLVLPVNSTFALSSSMLDMFAENNILFYDPSGKKSDYRCFGSYEIPMSGNTAEEKIWSGLNSFMTPEQAAGVMGNMMSESHFNPAQHEIGQKNKHQPGFALDANANVSYGLGLIQWSFGRRVGMYNFVKSVNPELTNYLDDYEKYSPTYWSGDQFISAAGANVFDSLASLELQYLRDELNSVNSYKGIFSATSVYDAAKFFLEHVEIPQNPQIEHHMNRVQQAEAIYSKYSGGGSNQSGAASYTSGGCSSADLNGLAEYVRAYVWPEYHPAVFLARKTEYAEAVERRIASRSTLGYTYKTYVGGSVGGVPGIDCGGFVTTIMQESGYDPEYNGCGSNTGPQEYWLRDGGGSDKWVWLNPDGNSMNAASLQLGDVAFTGGYPYGEGKKGCDPGGGHTYMFIGSGLGFETNIASASYGSVTSSARAPMSGKEGIGGARWYRKVK